MDFRDLQRNWDEFGRRSPVSAIDSGLRTDDWGVFFLSGERVVSELFETLAVHGFRPRRDAALDFGCGAGRLSQALAARFEHVVGVDVAPSMIALAERFNRVPDRCEFVLNEATDLGRFADGSFDFLYSVLVLQHVGPAMAEGYVREFVRVLRPGGLAVFQLPARLLAALPLESSIPADQAYRAGIREVERVPGIVGDGGGSAEGAEAGAGGGGGAPAVVPAGNHLVLHLGVTNCSPVTWRPSDLVRIGKRWLVAGSGAVVEPEDDGTRALLPDTVEPGEEVPVTLQVAVPSVAGDYLLEVDVVQEGVTWFRNHGSPTLVIPVAVTEAAAPVPAGDGPPTDDDAPAPDDDATVPRMEMHGVPRERVVAAVEEAGGIVLASLEDHSAGPEWESFLYVASR